MQEDEKTSMNAKQLLDWLMIGSEEDIRYESALRSELSQTPNMPNYEVLEKIGDAGQGQVWRAVHLGTRRQVALKVPKYHGMADRKTYLRFTREVEFISRLDHPNIVKIMDSGVHYGSYYFSMELIEGKHLDEYVYDKKLSVVEILQLFIKVCGAIEYAHANNVIHRDLKPSNILISSDGEPRILDFGLAKFDDEDESALNANMANSRAGTPAFMSPEQAGGQQSQVSRASDIYSLGVLLFNLLTDDFPIDHAGPKELVMQRISENKLKSWRGMKNIDGELSKIFRHIFQLEPQDRYAGVADLSRDIANYLTSRPLEAGSGSAWYRMGRLCQRNKFAVAISCAAIVFSLLLAGYISYFNKHQFREDFDSYEQGTVLASLPGWEMLLSSKPVTPLIVFSGQLKEAVSAVPGGAVIESYSLNVIKESRFNLAPGMSFYSDLDISFDGYWRQSVGLAFCVQDKDNFYFAELTTKTPEKDLLVIKKMQEGQIVEIAYKNMFELDVAHRYRLTTQFDGRSNIISAFLVDLSDNSQIAGIFSVQDKSFVQGRFGIITNQACHTFIDDLKIRIVAGMD